MAISKTTRKTTPRKATTRKKAATGAKTSTRKVAKPAPKLDVAAKLVAVSDPVVTQPELKKKELIDLVVERSGIKKKDAKPVVEAMLAVLGETIVEGRELNLQPLGKLRINRIIDKGNGKVIVCKLRQSVPGKGEAKDSVAEASDRL